MQQQRRLYGFALGLVAILTIGTAFLPWVRLDPLGYPLTWNGIGRSGEPVFEGESIGPHAYGWWVIAAAAIALIAAFVLMSAPSVAAKAPWVLWPAAIAALAATAVPITALVNPTWLIGDFMAEIGASSLVASTSELRRQFLVTPVLSFTIVCLVLIAVLSIGTALRLHPVTTRLRLTVERG